MNNVITLFRYVRKGENGDIEWLTQDDDPPNDPIICLDWIRPQYTKHRTVYDTEPKTSDNITLINLYQEMYDKLNPYHFNAEPEEVQKIYSKIKNIFEEYKSYTEHESEKASLDLAQENILSPLLKSIDDGNSGEADDDDEQSGGNDEVNRVYDVQDLSHCLKNNENKNDNAEESDKEEEAASDTEAYDTRKLIHQVFYFILHIKPENETVKEKMQNYLNETEKLYKFMPYHIAFKTFVEARHIDNNNIFGHWEPLEPATIAPPLPMITRVSSISQTNQSETKYTDDGGDNDTSKDYEPSGGSDEDDEYDEDDEDSTNEEPPKKKRRSV